ncbi:hypothetical protein RJ45_06690 [Photobacterium gaetbulicola]|uniref:Uncharacterized protein n=1 Tax=Photobacterium gaetbulicola TaxID=1295392 RepID=A0A0B9H096_9GAMM|nr:iron-containing alcohol dehydrogenase [Photobacterium gaetbulicola]KHT64396.1 hypothetical protein RJ45_06690 [Photobacterium gaetbulicola]
MKAFSIPTQLFSGISSLDVLQQYHRQRIWIVCDQFLADSNALKSILETLRVRNEVALYTDVTPDPTTVDVAMGIDKMANFSPDTVIAYGGGSAIDLTKAILYLSPKDKERRTFIAIPTTSGTGSEVTQFSVVTVADKQIKVPLYDEELLPDIAILNAFQTLTVPPEVTANTGIDVLTHAIEAMVSINHDDFSNALAEKAITLVFKYLKPAYDDGNNLEARQKLLNASSLAGLAFNHAGLGLTHAIAHQLGASLHIPHGLANARLLTKVMEFNCQSTRSLETYATLARCLGFVPRHTDAKTGAHAMIKATGVLIASLGIDTGEKLKCDAGLIHTMATRALEDPTLKTNPIQPDYKAIKQIIEVI